MRAFLTAQLVKDLPAMQETPVRFLGWEVHWRMDRLPTPVFLGFPCGSAGKESACYAGDLSLISELGKSPGEGKGYPRQYSAVETSMDCIAKCQTRLNNLHMLRFIQSRICMIYSTYKLNKVLQYTALTYSFLSVKLICCSMPGFNCFCFLTSIQISQEAGQVVWYSHLFKNFPQYVVIHTKALT